MNETTTLQSLGADFIGAALGAVLGFAAAYLMYMVTTRTERRERFHGLVAGLVFELRANLQNALATSHPGTPGPGSYYTHFGARLSTTVYRAILANPLYLDFSEKTRTAVHTAYRRIDYIREIDSVVQALSIRPEQAAQVRASTQGAALNQAADTIEAELQPAIDALIGELRTRGLDATI